MVAFDIADYNSAGHDSTDDDSTGQRWADYSADHSTNELKRVMVQLVTIRPVTGKLDTGVLLRSVVGDGC